MSNRKSSFITKFAHAHYYIITGIISWSVDSRHITYISKGVCFRSSVSVGTGLFPDAVDGACRFFFFVLAVHCSKRSGTDYKFSCRASTVSRFEISACFVSLCITVLLLT